MTTIVYKNGILMGDRKVTHKENKKETETTKIRKASCTLKGKKVVAVGFAGNGKWAETVVALSGACDLGDVVALLSQQYSDVVVGSVLAVFADKSSAKVFYNNEIKKIFIINAPANKLVSIGSGGKYAMLGVRLSMWLASKLDPFTGSNYNTISV